MKAAPQPLRLCQLGFEAPAWAVPIINTNPTGAGWTFTGYQACRRQERIWPGIFSPGHPNRFSEATGSISNRLLCCRLVLTACASCGAANHRCGAQGILVTSDSTNIGTFNPVNSSR